MAITTFYADWGGVTGTTAGTKTLTKSSGQYLDDGDVLKSVSFKVMLSIKKQGTFKKGNVNSIQINSGSPSVGKTQYSYETAYLNTDGSTSGSSTRYVFGGDLSFNSVEDVAKFKQGANPRIQAHANCTGTATTLQYRVVIIIQYTTPRISWTGNLNITKNADDPSHTDIKWNSAIGLQGPSGSKLSYDVSCVYKVNGQQVKKVLTQNTSVNYLNDITPFLYNTDITYTVTAKYSICTSAKTQTYAHYGDLTQPTQLSVVQDTDDDAVNITWVGSNILYGGGRVLRYDIEYTDGNKTYTAQNITSGGKVNVNLSDGVWSFAVIAVYSQNTDVKKYSDWVSIALSFNKTIAYYDVTQKKFAACMVYRWDGNQWQECVIHQWDNTAVNWQIMSCG